MLIGWLSIGQAAYLENISVSLQQPDGTKLNCWATGDEYYVRIHNEANYTITQNQDDGYYYYAQLINDKIVPTFFRADQSIESEYNLKNHWIL